jgi:hypothetical protein
VRQIFEPHFSRKESAEKGVYKTRLSAHSLEVQLVRFVGDLSAISWKSVSKHGIRQKKESQTTISKITSNLRIFLVVL